MWLSSLVDPHMLLLHHYAVLGFLGPQTRLASLDRCAGGGGRGIFWEWEQNMQHADVMWNWHHHVSNVAQQHSGLWARFYVKLPSNYRILPSNQSFIMRCCQSDDVTSMRQQHNEWDLGREKPHQKGDTPPQLGNGIPTSECVDEVVGFTLVHSCRPH